MNILPLFCEIDDFCKVFEQVYQAKALTNGKRRKRATKLAQSEVLTIPVRYHASGYKNLKAFYLQEIVRRHSSEFPGLCSYQRFMQPQARCVMPLFFHLVTKRGEILGSYVTAANVDEREPTDWITQKLTGKLIGDKGYIYKTLFERLMKRGLKFITKLRQNMKNRFVEMHDKLLLKKRAIIETVNDQLKNISNIEHSKHRSI